MSPRFDSDELLPREVGQRLDDHLDAIDQVLVAQGLSRSQRQAITGEVDAQVREMLAARSTGRPTLPDLEAVLAELDPPEAYASDSPMAPATSTPPTPASPPTQPSAAAVTAPRVSGLAVAGVLVAILGPFVSCVLLPLPFIGVFFTLPGFVIVPIASTVLGVLAINQIRDSSGQITGLPLALFAALFYPLLLLDGLIVALTTSVGALAMGVAQMPEFQTRGAMSAVVALGLLLALFADLLIVAGCWRWLSGTEREASARPGLGPWALVLVLLGWLVALPLMPWLAIPLRHGMFHQQAMHGPIFSRWTMAIGSGTSGLAFVALLLELGALVLGVLAVRSTSGKVATVLATLSLLGMLAVVG